MNKENENIAQYADIDKHFKSGLLNLYSYFNSPDVILKFRTTCTIWWVIW